jgi:hypothetical protein
MLLIFLENAKCIGAISEFVFMISIFRCPDQMCAKPCVTLRAFRMHAKCLHKGTLALNPILEEAKANYICKVRGCGKLFVEEQQLDVHFKHHENYTPR